MFFKAVSSLRLIRFSKILYWLLIKLKSVKVYVNPGLGLSGLELTKQSPGQYFAKLPTVHKLSYDQQLMTHLVPR